MADDSTTDLKEHNRLLAEQNRLLKQQNYLEASRQSRADTVANLKRIREREEEAKTKAEKEASAIRDSAATKLKNGHATMTLAEAMSVFGITSKTTAFNNRKFQACRIRRGVYSTALVKAAAIAKNSKP